MTDAHVDPTCKYDSPHPFQGYAHFVHLVSTESETPPAKIVTYYLRRLMEMEKSAFYSILPALFRFLPLWCVDNSELILLAVENLDAIQV